MTATKFAVARIQRAKMMISKISKQKKQPEYRFYKVNELKADVFQKTSKITGNNKARKAK